MHWIVILVGLLICAAGVVMLVSPAGFKRFIKSIMSRSFMGPAVAFRILIGILFLVAAPGTQAPLYVRILGVLFILAGLLLPLVGRDRIEMRVERVTAWSDPTMRVLSLVAIAFGASIVWAGWV